MILNYKKNFIHFFVFASLREVILQIENFLLLTFNSLTFSCKNLLQKTLYFPISYLHFKRKQRNFFVAKEKEIILNSILILIQMNAKIINSETVIWSVSSSAMRQSMNVTFTINVTIDLLCFRLLSNFYAPI
jgi:hypothetical protein